jgi:transposase
LAPLEARIEGLSQEIEALAHQDPACERLMTVPGIGAIISSAMVAAIGNGVVRDFGAWLGLVPKQISTGDRTILGPMSRRGNRYLRALFVQAAWVVLVRIKDWDRHGLKAWIDAPRRDCTTMSWRSRLPTGLPALRGRFSTRSAHSNA